VSTSVVVIQSPLGRQPLMSNARSCCVKADQVTHSEPHRGRRFQFYTRNRMFSVAFCRKSAARVGAKHDCVARAANLHA
jgi:hypothetical protein